MAPAPHTELRHLLLHQRQAALATIAADGTPNAAMVLYALDVTSAAAPAALIYVSQLAAHTRHLHTNPQAALLVMQPDMGTGDPQALPRVTLHGAATLISREQPAYHAAQQIYLARLPTQEYLFSFADFRLFQIELHSARYIGGFAQAYSLDRAALTQLLCAD
jgi:putative heme iron utilization protein